MQAYIWVVDIADDKMYFILNKDGQGSQTKILSNVYPRLSFVLLYIYFFNLVKIFIVDRSLLPVNIASKRLLSATLASGTIFVYFRAFFSFFFCLRLLSKQRLGFRALAADGQTRCEALTPGFTFSFCLTAQLSFRSRKRK